jgi:predicted nucleic acid-binding protein
MIFVDTGGWFATFAVDDPDHAAADAWLANNKQPLLTTDYVIDETLTLLRIRRKARKAIELGVKLFSGELGTVYYLTPEDIAAAWKVFRDFADKQWSFTDCTSKVVMERLGVTIAFAFDHHFRQFGTVTVVP